MRFCVFFRMVNCSMVLVLIVWLLILKNTMKLKRSPPNLMKHNGNLLLLRHNQMFRYSRLTRYSCTVSYTCTKVCNTYVNLVLSTVCMHEELWSLYLSMIRYQYNYTPCSFVILIPQRWPKLLCHLKYFEDKDKQMQTKFAKERIPHYSPRGGYGYYEFTQPTYVLFERNMNYAEQ